VDRLVSTTSPRTSPEAIAEKFALDVDYWYDFEVETGNVTHFDGLRHPVDQQGTVTTWEVIEWTNGSR